MQVSYVYFLFLGDKIKIGKANDLDRRITKLEKDWGQFNQNKSFVLKCNKKNVNKLERALHALLLEFRITDLDPSLDGYTEFFNISCLNKVESIIPLIDYAEKVGFVEELIGIHNNYSDIKEILFISSISSLHFDLLITLISIGDNGEITLANLEKRIHKKIDKSYIESISKSLFVIKSEYSSEFIFEEIFFDKNKIIFKLNSKFKDPNLRLFCLSNLNTIVRLRGFFSKKIFLLIQTAMLQISLVDLQKMLNVSISYMEFKVFNNKVLKQFFKESIRLNLNISVEPIKTGRKVTAIQFIKN